MDVKGISQHKFPKKKKKGFYLKTIKIYNTKSLEVIGLKG
jgi:hypothetical protein